MSRATHPRRQASAAKVSKASVGYVDRSQSATERCGICSMFRMLDRCTLVEGRISPYGHCRRYDPAMAEFQRGVDAKTAAKRSPFAASPAGE